MIVEIAPGVRINPAFVIAVRRDFHERMLLVSMQDGSTREAPKQYGESIFQTEARIEKLLNQPMSADVFTSRGVSDLARDVASLGESGYRIVAVIDTQNGDYQIVAQMGA